MNTNSYKQYRDLKEKHPDAVLLFRTGDFYEIFEDDAEICNKILGVSIEKMISSRSCTGMPKMKAKFPHHALDIYLPRLIRAGYRVAICDQLDAPTKKLVKRGSQELSKWEL